VSTTDASVAADGPATTTRRRPVVSPLLESWRYGRTKLGLALTAVMVLVALVGPLVAPHSASEIVVPPFSGPSGEAPLGGDYLGHDVLSRVLWGGRSVLWMAFAATTLGVIVGVTIGMIAAYSRNVLDDLLMRALDVVLAFPGLVLALLFVSLLGPKPWLIVLLVGLGWVPGVARTMRGVALDIVNREFVEAAEAFGMPRRNILRREVLPNLMTPLMVEYGLRLTWSIAAIAALSFLGFGIQPPAADWGLMVNENRNGLTFQAWAVAAPILCIAILTVGTNLLAEGIARSVAGIDREVAEP
jgi:peptide/nickel transport system permease protein